jgi:monofunctional glycosyltransferase
MRRKSLSKPLPAKKGKRLLARRILVRTLKVLACLLVLSAEITMVLRWVAPPTTAVILERRLDAFLRGRKYIVDSRWVRWDQISSDAALAVIAAEDQNFAAHHGFDFGSMQKALNDHERGRRLRGASTISQQVAKNVFLWSGRSFFRKGLEAYFTVLIEFTWPKRRILEVYLNIVELGDGVFGVEAAGRRYFRKSAAQLQPQEAALLAAVLPNPLRLKADRPSDYVEERRSWILQQMEQLGGTAYVSRF